MIFISYILLANILYSQIIKTNLLHNTLSLFQIRSPKCFDKIYLPSSGSHTPRCFNLELSHVFTVVVVFTIIKLLKSSCSYNTVGI
jgi:hypothetical protein